MNIPWFLFILAFAVMAYAFRQIVVAVVVWKAFRKNRNLIPVARLLKPDLTPEENL